MKVGKCVWINPRDGRPYARVWWRDEETGRRREQRKRAESRTHAKDLAGDMAEDIKRTSGSLADASRMTLAQLVKYYEKHYCHAPVYAHGRKVSGLRSHANVKSQLVPVVAHFGTARVRSISYEHIRAYKAKRLRTKTRCVVGARP